MIKWLVKKYVVGKVNDLLEEHKEDVSKVTQIIEVWVKRLQSVIESLNKINARVADGKVDASEIDDSVKDIEEIIKGW